MKRGFIYKCKCNYTFDNSKLFIQIIYSKLFDRNICKYENKNYICETLIHNYT